MDSKLPRHLQRIAYEEEAEAYLRRLPPEHFMESTAQSTQRAITVASLELVTAQRPDVQVFSELLVQYPRRGQRRPGQVVPDNMVVLTTEPIRARLSYSVPLEPAPPFWVLEYVSQGNKRKDYDTSFRKYERELKVRYYLIFYSDNNELTLFRHNGRKYVTTKPNAHGRLALPQLDLEMALLDGWVRYWYRGKLLPLPAELQRSLEEAHQHLAEARQQADAAERREAEARQQADAAERREAEARQQADAAQRRAEEARQQAESAQRRAEDLQQRLAAAERELLGLRAGRE